MTPDSVPLFLHLAPWQVGFCYATVLFGLISISFMSSYLGLPLRFCAGILILSVLAGFGVAVLDSNQLRQHPDLFGPEVIQGWSFLMGSAVFLGIPFLIRVVLSWMRGNRPMSAGTLALHLGYIVFISFGLVMGFNQRPYLALVPVIFALVGYGWIYGRAQREPRSIPADGSPLPDRTAEREKVLSMLEQGKITAEESVDLLRAIGNSRPENRNPEQVPAGAAPSFFNPMILIGAVLVLIGFFLPWLRVDLANEIMRMNQMLPQMGDLSLSGVQVKVDGQSMNPGINFPGSQFGSMLYYGANLNNGLGWFILLFPWLALFLPRVLADFTFQQQKTAALVTLALGTVLLLFVIFTSFRFLQFGIGLVAIGYLLEFAGILRQKSVNVPAALRSPRPVMS